MTDFDGFTGPTRRAIVAGLPAAFSFWQASGTGRSVPNAAGAKEPSIGNLFPVVEAYAETVRPRLSFLEDRWKDLDSWKTSTRESYRELLHYAPASCEFASQITATREREGYRQEDLVFQSSPSVSVPASLLIPKRQRKGRPALVLLHDHGGFYYFGKDKLLENDNEPAALTAFRNSIYPGGATGPIFARAGYVVLTIDAFYFGGRRLDVTVLPTNKVPSLKDLRPGSDEFIRASNKIAHDYEDLVAKTLFMSGTTWPGILLWDDLRSVDYLLTRPEVNSEQIGCLGLSLGGYRSTHLAAFHPKIQSSVICCFMSSYPPMLRNDVEHHTWMVYVPGSAELLDLPDVASLAAPHWRLVQYGRYDPLFPLAGKQESADKLQKVYTKAKVGERLQSKFYDAPHMLSRPMQADALAWFAKTLA